MNVNVNDDSDDDSGFGFDDDSDIDDDDDDDNNSGNDKAGGKSKSTFASLEEFAHLLETSGSSGAHPAEVIIFSVIRFVWLTFRIVEKRSEIFYQTRGKLARSRRSWRSRRRPWRI